MRALRDELISYGDGFLVTASDIDMGCVRRSLGLQFLEGLVKRRKSKRYMETESWEQFTAAHFVRNRSQAFQTPIKKTNIFQNKVFEKKAQENRDEYVKSRNFKITGNLLKRIFFLFLVGGSQERSWFLQFP